ncbi:unnamed protein product, partial [Vitis vinifera]|uniref:Dolichyl-diphosphooligosaccharide-protein glycosyltransferase subunit OST5 n=2 Tax=Vitis vinifera TaxID=29760 RepID=D7TB73_VITVI
MIFSDTPLQSLITLILIVEALKPRISRRKLRSRVFSQIETVVLFSSPQRAMAPAAKPITSPVPDAWYPTLAVLMLAVGLVITASFFIYEATSSRKSRSLAKELTTGTMASIFLGFGSLFLLLSSGVYV